MKKHTIQIATTLALLASSIAHAQDAVQWKLSDGGNGHWYQLELSPMGWSVARSAALAKGGDLASLESDAELSWVRTTIPGHPWPSEGCHLGGFQAPSSPSPDAGWSWLTGGQVAIQITLDFDDNPCGQGCCGENNEQNFLHSSEYWQKLGDANEIAFSPSCPGSFTAYASLIEWSADCNSDGIADYGQCHDGTLPDYNSNNIPDCCERGEACVASDYPMRWRVEDGGNGHWYKLLHVLPSESAEQHFIRAQEAGGYTATISSAEENRVCFGIANSAPIAVLIGIRKQAGNNIPEWITGEPWAYSHWHSGEGSNSSERYADYVPEWGGQWQDTDTTPQQYSIIEWSADCNNDGIVDKGQILQGQLADANGDGVPDVCQQPTCHDADLFVNGVINGADLGILLSQWGPAPIGTVSDINRDGQVNGADLGFLLNAWGPCPN